MAVPNPAAPRSVERHIVTDVEILAWVYARMLDAEKQKSQSYFPRFKERNPAEAVRHASLIMPLPPAYAANLATTGLKIFSDAGPMKGWRFLQPESMHVTSTWVKPGTDQASDREQFELARGIAPEVTRLTRSMSPVKAKPVGLMLLRNQLVVVYDAAGWNAVSERSQTYRQEIPLLDKGNYDMSLTPLDFGPVVQTTIAVCDRTGMDLRPHMRALARGHGLPVWHDQEPVTLKGALLLGHIHNPETVMSRDEVLSVASFGRAAELSAEAGGQAGHLTLTGPGFVPPVFSGSLAG